MLKNNSAHRPGFLFPLPSFLLDAGSEFTLAFSQVGRLQLHFVKGENC